MYPIILLCDVLNMFYDMLHNTKIKTFVRERNPLKLVG